MTPNVPAQGVAWLTVEPASELAAALEAIARAGWSDARCAEAVHGVEERAETHAGIAALASSLAQAAGDTIERAVLLSAARHNWAALVAQPVIEPVRAALVKELSALRQSRPLFPLSAGTYNFCIAAKMVSLRRWPAGPMDWEISGIPRSWLPKIPVSQLARALACLYGRMRGGLPLFFMHVAPQPRVKALVMEREILRSWRRMALCLEQRPEMTGIAAHAWFLDPAAAREQINLRWIALPFVELGGFLTTVGWAAQDSGVLEGNPERARRFLAGEVKYRMGLGLWPREAAIAWARSRTDLE